MEDYGFLIPNEDKSLILSDSFIRLVSDIENLVDLGFKNLNFSNFFEGYQSNFFFRLRSEIS